MFIIIQSIWYNVFPTKNESNNVNQDLRLFTNLRTKKSLKYILPIYFTKMGVTSYKKIDLFRHMMQ